MGINRRHVARALLLVSLSLAPLAAGCAAAKPRDLAATMVGWWRSDKDADGIYNIDARLRIITYSDAWKDPFMPGYIDGEGVWCPAALEPDGAVRIRWGGALGAWEGRTGSGRYRVELLSADQLKWTLLDESEHIRSAQFGDALFTRVPKVEAMIGRWGAANQQDGYLALGQDMHYRLSRGAAGEAVTVFSGAFRWDPVTEQVRLLDGAESPCSDKDEGRYEVDVKAGKQLKLSLVSDACAARRDALVSWGPYVPNMDYSPLMGCYVDRESGRYELCLNQCGLMRLWDLQREAAIPDEGAFESWGQTVRLTDLRGATKCRPEPGDYTYALDGDDLTLVAAGDACDKRVQFFAANPVWVRE